LRLEPWVFAAPIPQRFNQSIIAGVIPSQWKTAICPATQSQVVFADQFAFRPTGSTVAA